jgi:lysophospholipase L1-like esterase
MNYRNIKFHNTVELEPVAGGGLALRRFPKAVRNCLSPLGRMVAQESAGCELRFVTDAENIRLSVSSMPSVFALLESNNQDVVIFKGAFFHSYLRLEPGKINHINLTDIGGAVRKDFLKLTPNVRDTDYFAHNVWRILFGRYPAVFHELDTCGYLVRVPTDAEMPKKRMLCYGSSITNGCSPTLYHLSYVQQAARLLKVDVFNQGMSGSCFCEKEMADYLAGRDDWDIITLELGVNMRGGFTPDAFKSRSRYLIKKVVASHPGKPVFLITIYPNAESRQNAMNSSEIQQQQLAFDDIIRGTVQELDIDNLHLIEGQDILTDYSGITKDLIHPGDYGHMEMGFNLARKIREIFEQL